MGRIRKSYLRKIEAWRASWSMVVADSLVGPWLIDGGEKADPASPVASDMAAESYPVLTLFLLLS